MWQNQTIKNIDGVGNESLREYSKLILFTRTFPYGYGEEFLEAEIPFYNTFKDVVFIPIAAQEKDRKTIRNIPLHKYKIVDIRYTSFIRKLCRLLLVFLHRYLWHDLFNAIRRKGFRGFLEVVQFTVNGDSLVKQLKKYHIFESTDNIIFYSYWLHLTSYVALEYSKNYKNPILIARCHRYDLYEERNGGYLPYRKYLINSYNRIYCISDNGRNYLKSKYPEYSDKYRVSRLGTVRYSIQDDSHGKNEGFTIVSCSSMIKIKRIDKIIKSLSMLSYEKINWIHFGDGPEKDMIIQLATEKFTNSSIKFHFYGRLKNSEILNYYAKNYVHCFINMSLSEGIPVSIMEAMSFGIPIIATDVGGSAEIVFNRINGLLLEKDFTNEEGANAISEILHLYKEKFDAYIKYRINSRKIWDERCDAQKNYPAFINEIKNLRTI